jgi:PhnB protein
MYKPEGSNSVSPYLLVDDAAGTIDFLVKAFGAVEIRRFLRDGTRIKHAEVRLDDTVVMIADSLAGWPAVPAHVHYYLPDVDAAYARALAAGAESVQPPVKGEDEDKRAGVKDAGGTTWWIATKVE